MSPWFDQAFGPWYLKLYPHRDLAEARGAIRAVEPWLPRTGRILDIGCGRGRHLEALQQAGRDAVGIDRSRTQLEAVPPDLRERVVRGDMRHLPYPDRAFAAVLSMFTSFGYFRTRADHRALLVEFARVAAERGRLVLDYMNAPQVRQDLCPETCRVVAGHRVEETRRIENGPEGERVVKELVIQDGEGRPVERYHEEVALYDPEDVLDMMGAAGWIEEARIGDYHGASWEEGSPRLILVAVRGAAS